jgi:heme-degrading monooxygenase HmoA
MSLFKLPWLGRRRVQLGEVLVFGSRFDNRNLSSALVLLVYGPWIWLTAVRTPGCVGASLWAKPLRGRYYTFSAWENEEALRKFASTRAHRVGIKMLRKVGNVDGVLISWWEGGTEWRPRWRAAMKRLDASPTGPYSGPAQAEEQEAA